MDTSCLSYPILSIYPGERPRRAQRGRGAPGGPRRTPYASCIIITMYTIMYYHDRYQYYNRTLDY